MNFPCFAKEHRPEMSSYLYKCPPTKFMNHLKYLDETEQELIPVESITCLYFVISYHPYY
jgi:hypothetical protein